MNIVYCEGKYHGEIKKKIPDGEKYCLLCKKRKMADKNAKKEERNKILKNVGTVAVSVATLTFEIINSVKSSSDS